MMRSRKGSTAPIVVALLGAAAVFGLTHTATHTPALPDRIADTTFWRIVTTFSEPSGTFPSENFVSNETEWQYVIPPNLDRIRKGAAYLGVGPEQNFTYISAFQPGIAFICDIRRQNMLLHLMYKALFEISRDRADFLSKLWARPRPNGLDSNSTGADLARAFELSDADSVQFERNLDAILTQLVRVHGFPINSEDSATIRAVYGVFHADGPYVSYSSSSMRLRQDFGGAGPLPGTVTVRITSRDTTYHIRTDQNGAVVVLRDSAGVLVRDTMFLRNPATHAPFTISTAPGYRIPPFRSMYATFSLLMGLDDGTGRNRGWLGSEAAFQWVKDFESRNLVIPVVGNFAGPKALRAIGDFLREHQVNVAAFYTSNVEQYLFQSRLDPDFYENVATLPRDDHSTFIRSIPNQFTNLIVPRNPGSRLAQTTSSIDTVVAAYRSGELTSYLALQRIQDR